MLPTDAQSFRQQHPLNPVQFPDDHAGHPHSRGDTWRFKAHVQNENGDRFGLQLSFIRFSLKSQLALRRSAWASHQLSQATLSFTDTRSGQFLSHERFSRLALGISGFDRNPTRGWVDDWRFDYFADNGAQSDTFRISGLQNYVEFDLAMTSVNSPFVNDEDDSANIASTRFHYYLLNRMSVKGTISIDRQKMSIHGNGWMDHSWGNLPLPVGQVVWDLFLLHFEKQDLMLLNRHRRGEISKAHLSGLIFLKSGEVAVVSANDMDLDVLKTWTSHLTQATYPVQWRIRLAKYGLDIEVEGVPINQESRHSIPSWNGLVIVRSGLDDDKMIGNGFAELHGY